MTENHSEFTKESGVDHPADVGQKTSPVNDTVLNGTQNERTANFNETYDFEVNENNNKEDLCSELSNDGCEEESSTLHDYWVQFSSFFKKFYRAILEGRKPPAEFESHMNIVRELVANDPHQLFARLEMDLQEFIIEVKLRQLKLLNCINKEQGPHLFIFCLLESYNKLMFAACTLSPLLLELEVEHLARFHITWGSLNQHLFHKLVFTEPKIQKVLPLCISKLGKTNSELSDFNKRLLHQFLTFGDEMTKVGGRWREAESAIIKYHQENSMLDAKWRMTKVNWDLIRSQTKAFHEELKSSGISPGLDIESLKISSDESKENCADNVRENGEETLSKKNTLLRNKKSSDTSDKGLFDLEWLKSQQLCDCCHSNATQGHTETENLSLDSLLDLKVSENGLPFGIEPSFESDMLFLKMDSYLSKFKAHQSTVGGKAQNSTSSDIALKGNDKDSSINDDIGSTLRSAFASSEMHKSQLRKQMIQQQRQQHQKKLMQMMQSSQQKDIQHKIQKQLQEYQSLLQQQRKIDELHNHLLQQHPLAADKEAQKNAHLQVQHRLMQKHKQVEDKLQHQVQQYMQQHQDKPSNASAVGSCNHSKNTIVGSKNNHKCPSTSNGETISNNSSLATTPSNTTHTTTASNVKNNSSSTGTNLKTSVGTSMHKNSTTQTTVVTSAVNGEGWYLCPSADGKSTSYVCPKNSDESLDQNSFDNSSDDEFDWDNGNSPQRHCNCCYCQVYGSAPVSRNFQETRERLRLILTKKKAKSNAAKEVQLATDQLNNGSTCTNAQSTSQQGGKIKKDGKTDGKNDPVYEPIPEYMGKKSIDEILDFIEGNKRNAKRTAKKQRRKQRQQEEDERRRKEEEEAEMLRQEELRRQEEEEKRRLEEERKKQEMLRKQDRKKNKKQKQQQQQATAAKTQTSSHQNNSNNKKGKSEKAQPQVISDNAKLAQSKKGQKQVMDKSALQKQVIQQQQQAKNANQAAKKKQQGQAAQQSKQQPKNAKNQKQAQPNTGKKVTQENKSTKGNEKTEKADENSDQPQMVTIKRVMQPNSNEPTVTITLRGPTPKEDKVLYTLHNGQISQIKNDKQNPSNPTSAGASGATKKKNTNANIANSANGANSANNISKNTPRSPPKSNNFNFSAPSSTQPTITLTNPMNYSKNCGIVGNGVNSITERMEKMKLGPQPVPIDPLKRFVSTPSAPQAELTTPTAIQINQAVSQLSSRPSFPNNFDLENIKLPPGITITKVDPATVQRRPIQVKQQPPPLPVPPPQTQIRQAMMPPMAYSSSNVIVVDTVDKNNGVDEQSGNKKKRRRRKKENGEMNPDMVSIMNAPSVPPYVPSNGLPTRLNPLVAGQYGNPFMNAGFGNISTAQQQQQQQPAAIIQMNGSMVTIRNPAIHQPFSGGQQSCADQNANMRFAPNVDMWNSNATDMFSSSTDDTESGDVDEYERELEAFKRFCSQSVPAESKAKVNLNIEDIVLKKKGPVIGCS